MGFGSGEREEDMVERGGWVARVVFICVIVWYMYTFTDYLTFLHPSLLAHATTDRRG